MRLARVFFNRNSDRFFSITLSVCTAAVVIYWLQLLILKVTISSMVIGFKKPLFFTNLLAKFLLDSLLSYSSISQSHLKLCLNRPITFKVVVRHVLITRKKKSGVTELVLKIRRITDLSISKISGHPRRFKPDSLLSAFSIYHTSE